MTPFTIYLWGIADNVHDMISFAAIVSLVAGMLASIFVFIALSEGVDKEEKVFLKRLLKSILSFAAFSSILSALTPDSKTVAAMVVIPAIAQSEAIQKDAPELYKMAIDRLKETLAEKP